MQNEAKMLHVSESAEAFSETAVAAIREMCPMLNLLTFAQLMNLGRPTEGR